MFIVSFLITVSCSFRSDSTQQKHYHPFDYEDVTVAADRTINVHELKSTLDKTQIAIVDVRTTEEFDHSHIPTAMHIPLSELQKDVAVLNAHKNKPIYLVCATGGRSGNAQKILLSHGFTSPINVMGGTNEWIKNNYPLEAK